MVQLNASGTPELLQLKLPYGAGRYAAASLANLGFTGQRKDTSPNLTYFNARFYDQDVGVFLSPDTVQDGPNPYAYVGGMVENATDPSGHMPCNLTCQSIGAVGTGDGGPNWDVFAQGLEFFFGTTSMANDIQTFGNGNATFNQKFAAGLNLGENAAIDASMLFGEGEVVRGAELSAEAGADAARASADAARVSEDAARLVTQAGDEGASALAREAEAADQVAASADNETQRALARDGAGGDTGSTAPGGCSFRADTPVATPSGERPIGDLKVGDTVEAYNPQTGQAEPEAVQHVWVNHDQDLLDVRLGTSRAGAVAGQDAATMTTTAGSPLGHGHLHIEGAASIPARSGSHEQPTVAAGKDETIHTTANHPWLTADRGWVAAAQLQPGEQVVTLGGGMSMVVWVQALLGQGTMYNLTVSHDHTYAVGAGQWVVHNTGPGCTGGEPPQGSNIVYRGLAEGESPVQGLTARALDAVEVDPVSHVAGKRASPWISTTRDPNIATQTFGKNGVVAIDLSQITARVVDYSNGIPGREGQMISNWAAKYQEVLIFQSVPTSAIIWWSGP